MKDRIIAVKGCLNKDCSAYNTKKHFNNKYEHCPMCGSELSYVCKKCGTRLTDGTRKLCVRCENEAKDKRDRIGQTIMNAVASSAKMVSDSALVAGKSIVDTAKNIGDELSDAVGDFAANINNKPEGTDVPVEENWIVKWSELGKIKETDPDLYDRTLTENDNALFGFINSIHNNDTQRLEFIKCFVNSSYYDSKYPEKMFKVTGKNIDDMNKEQLCIKLSSIVAKIQYFQSDIEKENADAEIVEILNRLKDFSAD